MAAVEKEGGMELLVEALATVMAFESITRIVDASIRVKQSASMMMMIKKFNRAAAMFQSSRFLLICSAMAVAGVAMIIVTRKKSS